VALSATRFLLPGFQFSLMLFILGRLKPELETINQKLETEGFQNASQSSRMEAGTKHQSSPFIAA
jgi:hypothetical protein